MFIHNTQNRAYHCLKVTFTTHQSKRKRGEKTKEERQKGAGQKQTDLRGQTSLLERSGCQE